MHIHHRHFIALPLTAFFLGMVALSDHALVASVASPEGTVSATGAIAHGVAVVPLSEDGAAVMESAATLRIDNGSYVMRALRLGRAASASIKMVWFGGSTAIMRGQDTVTVVALDTPVLVMTDHGETLVPVGMQLRVQGATVVPPVAVPQVWIAEQRHKARLIPIPETSVTSWSGSLLTMRPDEAQDILETLPQQGLTSLIAERGIVAARVIEPGTSLAPLLALHLAFERHFPGVYGLLERTLLTLPDAQAWEQAFFASAQETTHPMPDHATTWLALAKRAAASEHASVCDRVRDVRGLASHYRDEGFPSSADAWIDAAEEMGAFCTSLALSAPVPVQVTMTGSDTAASVPDRTYDAGQSVERARYDAVLVGALLTTQTTFTAVAPTHRIVFIENILAHGGSEVLSLSYDTVTGMASGITRNGQGLPNAVELRMLFQ